MKQIKSKATRISIAVLSAVIAVFVMAASIGAPAAHAQFNNFAQALAGVIAVDNIAMNNGAFGSSDNLGELIVLSGLFPTSTNNVQYYLS